jgi:hypothetical protein
MLVVAVVAVVAAAPLLLSAKAAHAAEPSPVDEHPDKGLLMTGVGIAAGGYGLSAVIGGALVVACSDALPSASGSARTGGGTCTPTPGQAAWLFVPWAGPLVLAARDDASGGDRFWYVTLSGLQIVGSGLVASAFLFPKRSPARAARAVSVLPVPLPGGGAVTARATF